MLFAVAPGMRVQAARDIGSALGAVEVRRGTTGTVVEVRGWRTVLVQFDGGRCIGVDRRALQRVKPFHA